MGQLRSLPVAESRRPQGTVMHEIVRDNLGDYLDHRRQSGSPVSAFVVKDFNKFLGCGDIAGGSATTYCPNCDQESTVVFSCKRRGFCTHCLGRRQWDQSRVLQERVVGDTPVRPWVISLPPPLRNLAAFNSRLVTHILNGIVDEIFRYYRWKAKRELYLQFARDARPGSVTMIHRVSGDGRVNLHFHCILTDGVFVPNDLGLLVFREVSAPTSEELATISRRICRRVVKTLRRLGMWKDMAGKPGDPEETLAGHVTIGPDRRDVRFFAVTSESVPEDAVGRNGACAFELWAGQRIGRGQPKRLRRLLRYVLSPALTDEQLTRQPDGNVLLRLRRPRRDGSTTRVLTPFALLDILVNLTPRPRTNLVRFHGIWAPNAARRAEAVPSVAKKRHDVCRIDETPEERAAWAELLKRVHPGEARRCPQCRGQVHLLRLRTRGVVYERSRESIRASQRWRSSGQAAA